VLTFSRKSCPLSAGGKNIWLKLWQQPRCPTTDKWIEKMWYIYTMEYYSGIKKKEIMLFAGKWMKLENILLSEVSQVQKDKGPLFSLTWTIGANNKYTHKYKYDHICIHI
jgi:hypothetical protein